MSLSSAWKQAEVRVSAVLVVGGALLFLLQGVLLLRGEGATILYVPIVMLLINIGLAWIILAGHRALRPVVLVVVILEVLLQLIVLLGNGPVWARVMSGAAAAVLLYAQVVLNTKPARVHFGLDVEETK
jgi:hypothetical protein